MKRILWLVLLLACVTPVRANGWYPSLNSKGEVASGAAELTVAGRNLGQGWYPKWIDDDTIVYNEGNQTVILNVRTGAKQAITVAYSQLAAGGGQWVGAWQGNPVTLRHYRAATVLGAWEGVATPLSSPGGHWGYVTNYYGANHDIVLDGKTVISNQPIVDIGMSDKLIVYTIALDAYRRDTRVYPIDSSVVGSVGVFNWEQPTACDGPSGPWILSVTQKGLAFRAAGATEGFYWRGEFFNATCRWVGNFFRIASSDSGGRLNTMDVRPTDTASRLRYATVLDDCVECSTPPPSNPPPVVTPPAQVAFPKNLLADLQAERAKYPAQINQAQAGALLNAVAWKNKDLGFGLLRKDGGNRCSVNGLPQTISCDWIVNIKTGTGCDSLGSGPDDQNTGPSNPNWCDGTPFDTSKFLAPVQPADAPPPNPPSDVDKQIAQLQAQLAQTQQQRDDAVNHANDLQNQLTQTQTERDTLQKRIDALLAAPPPSCEAKLPGWVKSLGIRVGCRIIQPQ